MQRRRIATGLLWLAAGLPLTGRAQSAGGTAADVRGVIQAQLDAFRADDAERAFSYATPDVRALFGDAQRFLAMVKGSYRAVYRPAGVDFFLAPQPAGLDLIQQVRLTDADGAAWLAIYRLQRQPDGAWRIESCQLSALDGQAV